MSQDHAVQGNPYVGPRPFNEGETLYGRAQDTEALVDLLTAERLVLLYAPSGAGKTSLIQASLIPQLRDRQFHVLPSIVLKASAHSANGSPAPAQELGVGASAARPTNRYVDTVLLSLADSYGQPPSNRAPGNTGDPTPEWELKDWLATRVDSSADRRAEVLIFDQFEEVLTDPLVDEATRRDFFRQVGVALRDPWRWALFAMREDYLAGLDPYRRWIPNGFRTTYRLELLRPEAAILAIQEPARRAVPPVDFENDAARTLVDDLRRVRGEDREAAPRLGEFVEPVQLQVVCRRLWEDCADTGRVTADDVRNIDVDSALRDYYAEKVRGAATKAGESERTVRIWIDDKLITRDGLRDQVRYSHENSEGLDNRALEFLEASHLVRSDRRGDRRWWELAHDRLIEPVRQDNRKWLERNLQSWQMMARLWKDNPARNELLLHGKQLSEAERFKKRHPDQISTEDDEFLAESRREEDRAVRFRNLVRFVLGAWLAVAAFWGIYLIGQYNDQQADLRAEYLVSAALSPSTHPNLRVILPLASMNMRPRGSALNALAISVPSRSHFRAFLRDRSGEVNPEIHAVAYSPDGRWLASEGSGGTVNLRDAETRAIRQSLRTAATQLWSLAFSPDSRWLVAGGGDGTITVWDVATGRFSAACRPHSTPVSSLAFNPLDSSMLVSSGSLDSADTRLVVSRIPDCSPVKSLERDSPQHTGAVWSAAFDPQGARLVSADHGGTLIVWDTANWEPAATRVLTKWAAFGGVFLMELAEPCPPESPTGGGSRRLALTREGEKLRPCGDLLAWMRELGVSATSLDGVAIWSVAYSPDGSELAIASQERNIQIVDARTLRRKLDLPTVHHDSVRSVAYHPHANGKWLASASLDGTILLWDLQSYSASGQWTVARLEGHAGWVPSMAFGRDGSSLASAGYDGAVGIWSLWPEPTGGSTLLRSERNRWDGVWAVAFSRDGETLASGGTDSQLTFWDVSTRKPAAECTTNVNAARTAVTSIAASSTGMFASGIANGSVLLWEPPSCAPRLLGTRQPGVWSVAFSPDGRSVASGGSDGSITLWDPDGIQPPRTFSAHPWGKVWTLAFSPDGRLLASGGQDTTIAIWDIQTGTRLHVLRDHIMDVRSIAFSADGRWLASGSHDRRIGLWDVATWQTVRWLRELEGYVTSVAFSPDGTSIYAGGWDGKFMRWNRETGAHLWSFSGHDGNIWSVNVGSKHDGLLASGDDSGVLILWDTPNQARENTPVRSLIKRSCVVAAGLALEQQVLDRYDLTEQSFSKVCEEIRVASTPTVR